VAPIALGDAKPSLWVSLGALFIVILSASIGQALLQYVGSRTACTHQVAAHPGGRRDRGGRPECRGRAPGLLGARGWRSPARGSARSPRSCASRPCSPRSTRCCPTRPPTSSEPSTTSWERPSSRATSNPSPPSGSSRWGRVRNDCSPTRTWSTPNPACSRCGAATTVEAEWREADSSTRPAG
jgi:hypothetical protein